MELYHNNKILQKNRWMDSDEIINLELAWNYGSDIYYTLIIYDIDTPSIHVHLLVTNIPKNDIEYGTIILNYTKPNTSSNTHRYIIAVYEQSRIITDSIFKIRDKFPLSNFIIRNNLRLLDEKMIVVDPLTDQFYLDPPEDSSVTKHSKNNIIKQNSKLNDRSEKYCSCVVKVAEKNSEICNLEENWGKTISGKTCYSPYAVCAKSVGTTNKSCGINYNYETMTKEQLISFLNLKKIKVDRKLDKNQLLEIIQNKKL
jgi:hypothetical protein